MRQMLIHPAWAIQPHLSIAATALQMKYWPMSRRAIAIAAISCLCTVTLLAQSRTTAEPQLPREKIAQQNFGADAPWFLRNIPFLEIDDPAIQQIYYYRWKLYRAHIREIGPQGTTVLEFLPNVPWARQPFTDLNDSASFHITEGRWLRSPTTINNLIDHLYTGGANDRHFSESIAAATNSSTLVTGDPTPALRQLDAMQSIYNGWDDHFDPTRNLYWIEPLLDATEYTISSIDASGAGFTNTPSTGQNHNGFTGGFAFRPSINSYQYANALAIARLATLANKPDLALDYTQRANRLRAAVLQQLWNPTLQHFTDRYQRSTPHVTAGDFIRGRELVGYTPWLYELPPTTQDAPYNTAWQHLLSPSELAGPLGLRTVEPTYPKYLQQYRYDAPTGQPECQWNGPSWPFQTSQALTALANLLDDYPATTLTKSDYLHLLRQYTQQHFLTPNHPDLQEDYNPDTGTPIVGLTRSHHYNHSTYIDLILTGLIGIRPRADNILELDPLIPTTTTPNEQPIRYFALQDVAYHGHNLTILYDADGTRYHSGRGLSIYIDHKHTFGPAPLSRIKIPLPQLRVMGAPGPDSRTRASTTPSPQPSTLKLSSLYITPAPSSAKPRIDLLVNVGIPTGPIATASSTISPTSTSEAIDGRLWFFPEIPNGWSPSPDNTDATSWYSIDLRTPQTISSVELYFFADNQHYIAPSNFHLQYETNNTWQDIPTQTHTPNHPLANGENKITFPPIPTQQLRLLLTNPTHPTTFRLIEIEAFAP